jgi:hypothetical protein
LILNSIENIVFDLYEPNVFYAIGSKNQNFEQSQVPPTPTLFLDNNRLEKFFIESDSFSSKTIAYLELSNDPDETVLLYQFSKNQEKVAIISDKHNLSTFDLYEIRNPSVAEKANSPDNQAVLTTNNNENMIYEESKVTMVTKEF